MTRSVVVVLSFLLVGWSSAHIIPSQVRFDTESNVLSSENDQLVFAHVIYRHGERAMTGSMELNNEGKRQLFKSGQYLRRRYDNLIGGKYSPDKVYIVSTDFDRAIMSAQSSLAGMFPPTTQEERWNNEIDWQPVPVHTIPQQLDNLLHGSRPCPRFTPLVNFYRDNDPEVREIYEKYGHLFPYWSKMQGMPIETIEDVAFLHKILVTEAEEHKILPEWAQEALKPDGPLLHIVNVNYRLRGTPQLVRIRVGFLIKDMLERFAQKINGTLEPNRVLWIYSAHSSTIATLLNGLRINKEFKTPPHGSSLHFELYKNANDEYYLQMFYRKPDEENPSPIELPGCGEQWSMEKFRSVYEPIIPGEFEEECSI